ncbi:hypothetical protein NEUTE1DRAFT_135422 [Neurospora tetrasperma FGSC 2508]|uniref:Uncharacterized protein n=1 Tax=Neurospora tetrasperma (strain FGSC 2508 / ATCC MYA-4615 / P0657) TaxID=510951 RepID=F8MDP5_NEUT8|nr:uncharacterized protein NEUTE1DRAFT_135422 [Neurospora tetrasperma FGSC 2508]EGO61483.1 hypothetical protein NEUTE1DRAFT_135422 [Neurospora tetrasperma FGSC 2508]
MKAKIAEHFTPNKIVAIGIAQRKAKTTRLGYLTPSKEPETVGFDEEFVDEDDIIEG